MVVVMVSKCPTVIRLVTFDVTNTLLQFRQTPGRQYARAGRAYGLRVSEDQLAAEFRTNYRAMSLQYPNFGRSDSMSWQDWWRQLVGRTFRDHLPDPTKLDEIATRLIEDYKSESSWQVASGGEDLLRHLKQQNILVGVISNFDPRVYDILTNIGLHGYFNFIITSYEVGYSKPDARIFDEAIVSAGSDWVSPQSALHIGDNVKLDYHGARLAGWNALLVNSKIKLAEDIDCSHIYMELESLKDAIVQNKTPFSFKSVTC